MGKSGRAGLKVGSRTARQSLEPGPKRFRAYMRSVLDLPGPSAGGPGDFQPRTPIFGAGPTIFGPALAPGTQNRSDFPSQPSTEKPQLGYRVTRGLKQQATISSENRGGPFRFYAQLLFLNIVKSGLQIVP